MWLLSFRGHNAGKHVRHTLPGSLWIALGKYHRQGAHNQLRTLLLTTLGGWEVPRAKHRQPAWLLRVSLLVPRWRLLIVSCSGRGGGGSSLGTNPIHYCPPPTKFHFLVSFPCWSRADSPPALGSHEKQKKMEGDEVHSRTTPSRLRRPWAELSS